MLSKSRGHVLRVAATMHVLFHLETPLAISGTISETALKAAQEFVEVCNQHVSFLSGRGDIAEAIESLQQLQKGISCARLCVILLLPKLIAGLDNLHASA